MKSNNVKIHRSETNSFPAMQNVHAYHSLYADSLAQLNTKIAQFTIRQIVQILQDVADGLLRLVELLLR